MEKPKRLFGAKNLPADVRYRIKFQRFAGRKSKGNYHPRIVPIYPFDRKSAKEQIQILSSKYKLYTWPDGGVPCTYRTMCQNTAKTLRLVNWSGEGVKLDAFFAFSALFASRNTWLWDDIANGDPPVDWIDADPIRPKIELSLLDALSNCLVPPLTKRQKAGMPLQVKGKKGRVEFNRNRIIHATAAFLFREAAKYEKAPKKAGPHTEFFSRFAGGKKPEDLSRYSIEHSKFDQDQHFAWCSLKVRKNRKDLDKVAELETAMRWRYENFIRKFFYWPTA